MKYQPGMGNSGHDPGRRDVHIVDAGEDPEVLIHPSHPVKLLADKLGLLPLCVEEVLKRGDWRRCSVPKQIELIYICRIGHFSPNSSVVILVPAVFPLIIYAFVDEFILAGKTAP